MDIEEKIKSNEIPYLIAEIGINHNGDLDIAKKLIDAGYEARNIHLVWVLTDYKVAAKANKQRDRVVPDDILFMSHQKAAQNMLQRIRSQALGRGTGVGRRYVDGQIHTILNNRDKTSFYPNTKMPLVKDFSYITLKRSGKPYENDRAIIKTLMRWALENAPLSPASQRSLKKRFDL